MNKLSFKHVLDNQVNEDTKNTKKLKFIVYIFSSFIILIFFQI